MKRCPKCERETYDEVPKCPQCGTELPVPAFLKGQRRVEHPSPPLSAASDASTHRAHNDDVEPDERRKIIGKVGEAIMFAGLAVVLMPLLVPSMRPYENVGLVIAAVGASVSAVDRNNLRNILCTAVCGGIGYFLWDRHVSSTGGKIVLVVVLVLLFGTLEYAWTRLARRPGSPPPSRE